MNSISGTTKSLVAQVFSGWVFSWKLPVAPVRHGVRSTSNGGFPRAKGHRSQTAARFDLGAHTNAAKSYSLICRSGPSMICSAAMVAGWPAGCGSRYRDAEAMAEAAERRDYPTIQSTRFRPAGRSDESPVTAAFSTASPSILPATSTPLANARVSTMSSMCAATPSPSREAISR